LGTRIEIANRLPQGISLEEGALIEPLSVGIHASRRGEVKLGDRVFVFGAGPVGLLTAAAAKAAGAAHVTIADISESRLKFAKSYIANETIHLTNKPQPNEDTNAFAKLEAAKIVESGIEPANVVFDCTGVEVCVQMSIFVSKLDRLQNKDTKYCTCYLACQEQWKGCISGYGCLCAVNLCGRCISKRSGCSRCNEILQRKFENRVNETKIQTNSLLI
jgi:tRNA A58 N-methylase Trm61